MKTTTPRLLELALKGLELEKQRIEAEIQELQKQLKTASPRTRSATKQEAAGPKAKRHLNISPEEKQRRSERMKAYWADYRKKKGAAAASKSRAKRSRTGSG